MNRLYSILSKKSIVAISIFMAIFVYSNKTIAKEPADPSYSFQQGFYTQIGAPAAWDITTGSKEVVVAVIDTGIDDTHPDLIGNMWTNTKEIVSNGQDDDGNGFVDDVHGWNFVENNNNTNIPVIIEADDAGAVNHGTLLAGLIGAQGGNGLSGVGLNWNVRIMSLRAIDNGGGGNLADIAKAVNYAVDNGAHVISISFVGFTTEPSLTAALYRAYQKGVVVVAAAGNSRNDSSGNENLTKVKQFPICLDYDYVQNWILGVASVSLQDTLSYFADYGSCVDISAPGEQIFSTQKIAPESGFVKDFDGSWYGTSFSAPLVAGGAALIKSVRPDWGAKEIIDVLLRSADDIDHINPGFAGQIGYGRLNIGKALQMARSAKINPVKSPMTYTAQLVKKQKKYAVQVSGNGKVIADFFINNYAAKFSRWAVSDNLFVYARLSANTITVDVWDLLGNKKISSLKLPGFTALTDLKIEAVWGLEENAVLFVKKGKENKKIIIDIPSQSWKVE
jgi:subtilisin family serine protease